MKFTIGLLLIVFVMASCQEAKNNKSIKIDSEEISINSIDSMYTIVDSVFEKIEIKIDGSYKEFKITAFIQNKDWDTTYNLCESLGERCPSGYDQHKISWATDSFVGIREGCGSPCNYEIVIPIVSGHKPSSYFFVYTPADSGIELEEDLIAYNGTTNTKDGYPMVKIKNLRNGKVDSIAVDNTWDSRVSINEFVVTLFATKNLIMIGQYDSKGNVRIKKEKKINLH
jgi:hypothetical protein